MSSGFLFPSIKADALETAAYRHAMILGTIYAILLNGILPGTISHPTIALINLAVAIFFSAYEISIFKKRFPDNYASSFLKIKPLSAAIFSALKYCLILIGIFIFFGLLYSNIIKIEHIILNDVLYALTAGYFLGGFGAYCLLNIYFELIRFKKRTA
jgi:hypothetical protein